MYSILQEHLRGGKKKSVSIPEAKHAHRIGLVYRPAV